MKSSMKKLVKVLTFIGSYDTYRSPYGTLEEWQRKNPDVKILDAKLGQKVFTENVLIVTYEVDEPKAGE